MLRGRVHLISALCGAAFLLIVVFSNFYPRSKYGSRCYGFPLIMFVGNDLGGLRLKTEVEETNKGWKTPFGRMFPNAMFFNFAFFVVGFTMTLVSVEFAIRRREGNLPTKGGKI